MSTGNLPHKFGTFSGVFIPSVLTIFGPIMFMRFGYVTGNLGTIYTFIVLAVAQGIVLCTAFSIAAIATNTPVEEGGAYFMISRSLGAGFGGAIGLTLFLAQGLSVPFYIIGFVEALIGTFPFLQPFYLWISLLTGILLFYLAWTGAKWAIKAQIFIFILLMLAIAVFLLGAGSHYAHETLVQNSTPLKGVQMFVMFAIFFPAATGIMAGINMSGDLKKPGFSLVMGTFSAVIFATAVYSLEIFFIGSGFSRQDLIDYPYVTLVRNAIFGLGFLVVGGVFCATLSSAIGSFLGAPRILRALSKDKIIPWLEIFAIDNNGRKEPRKALIATFVISLGILIWAGLQAGKTDGRDPLNTVAQIVTMFFLYTYGIVNLAAFVESFGGNPSFRPKFKYFHWSISLIGVLSCALISFLIDYQAAVLALIFFVIIFFLAKKREMTQDFGDARRGFVYSRIRNNLIKLSEMPFNPKNWRPTIAAFTGNLSSKDDNLSILKFALGFEGGKGIISAVEFIIGDFDEFKEMRNKKIVRLKKLFNDNNLYSVFPEVIISPDFDTGLRIFLQAHSIGALKPNIILMGYPKSDMDMRASFVPHIKMIAGLEKSFVIFVDSDIHPDPEKPKGKFIDIWWKGHQNGSLMIIMAYILNSNSVWKDMTIRLIRIVDEEKSVQDVVSIFENIIKSARITAIPKVIVSKDFNSTLASVSKDSAAVFIGTNVPSSQEEAEEFFKNIDTISLDMPPMFVTYSTGDACLLA